MLFSVRSVKYMLLKTGRFFLIDIWPALKIESKIPRIYREDNLRNTKKKKNYENESQDEYCFDKENILGKNKW